ncbi:MAG: gliding motility-associated C-terminal domain-containing protein [Bacteroidetes bacterium]|nr:gliding motility-associated C-terminal domain-containing protein [Bacteroidota bacterium]
MKRKISFFISIVVFFIKTLSSQTNFISVSSTVPSDITICGESKLFSLTINNPSTFNLTNFSVSVAMPTGVNYVPGSVTGFGQSSIANLSAPTFTLASLAQGGSVVITYSASVECSVLGYLSLGNPIENTYTVNYIANSAPYTLSSTSLNYQIKEPNLSITNFSNQSFAGSVGGTFTRCLTITNGGLGAISQFTLSDAHGGDIQITSVTNGTITSNTSSLTTILLNGAHFTGVGNGNALLESGESIVICENVKINGCNSVASTIKAQWGCGGQTCQEAETVGNVTFNGLTPSLKLTPKSSLSNCLGVGTGDQQQLLIENIGAGVASNVSIEIFQSLSNGFSPSFQSSFNSFEIKVNNGVFAPLTPTLTKQNQNVSCLNGNTIGGATFVIPLINAGDSVIIRWNQFSCCADPYIGGWNYKGSYSDICSNVITLVEKTGKSFKSIRGTLSNNISPANIVSGSTGVFNFLISGYQNSYPAPTSKQWKALFVLSPCITFTNSVSNIRIRNAVGTITHNPTSIAVTGNSVVATFTTSIVSDQAEVMIDLGANCSSCAGGVSSVELYLSYLPTTTSCSCEMLIMADTGYTNVVCPQSCVGLNFKNFTALRSNYGLPDNDNNGVEDASGNINTSLIRRDRLMYHDTLETSFFATVKTNSVYPTWNYCYASSSITNGEYLNYIGGDLKIYRNNALFATCSISQAVTSTSVTFNYDLSASVLIANGCVPSNFLYLNNDSLVFKPRYRVVKNQYNGSSTGNPSITAQISNSFYLANIANPVSSVNKFSCNTFNGYVTIIGYYFTNYGPGAYNSIGCNDLVATQNYYLSIGPCCSNYAGGNLFPYEYRSWSFIDTMTVTIPTGYSFKAASIYEYQTAGTQVTALTSTLAITPINPSSNILVFPVGNLYSGINPTIHRSDDGFYGIFTITISPNCNVVQNTTSNILYTWKFNPSAQLDSSTSRLISTNGDGVLYSGPNFFLQADYPSQVATSSVVCWNISVSNVTNNNAPNTWIASQGNTGVVITAIKDLSNNNVISPVGGIYQLGTLNAGATKNYQVCTSYLGCTPDSLILVQSWNCNGYPANINANTCVSPKSMKLKVFPQTPLLVTNVISPSSSINLCDTSTFVVEGQNIQMGNAYSVLLNAQLPVGVTIVPGSCQILYPITSGYVPLTNPTNVGGTNWQWNISTLNSTIGGNGLQGILSPTLNAIKVKFQVTTDCSYLSGSTAVFYYQAQSFCGSPAGRLVTLSSQLSITGATPNYFADVKLKELNYITPCNGSQILRVRVKNNGPLAFGGQDSVTVMLPLGVTYTPASFIGVHNSPVNTNPISYIFNGSQYVSWLLPSGVLAGDSTVFTIGFQAAANVLSCNVYQFYARTTTSTNVLCVASNQMCGISVLTGLDTLDIFSLKSLLTFTNVSGYSVPNPPNGETAHVSFDIVNSGETVAPGFNTILGFYFDLNNNGIVDIGDNLIATDTINTIIPGNNAVFPYSSVFNFPAGVACRMIVVVNPATSFCVCDPAQLPFSLPLRNQATDTSLCDGQAAIIGANPIIGYTYSWNSSSGLSNTAIANPVFTATNSGINPLTTIYTVTVNRAGYCSSIDTATVVVYNKPVAFAGVDSSYCAANSVLMTGTNTQGSSTGMWSQLVGAPTNATFAVPANANTNVTGLQEGTYDFVWTVNNGVCAAAKDTVKIKTYNVPIANAGADISICAPNASASFGATPLTGLSTGAWVQSSGATTAVISNSVSPTSLVSNLSVGTYQFVWTVVNGVCPSANDSVRVLVATAPTASVSVSDNSVCMQTCINFNDLSMVYPGDNITSWSWNFGNSLTSNLQSPQNICYDSSGVYTVSLTINTAAGCVASTTLGGGITVYSSPQASFNVTPSVVDMANPVIQVTNTSSDYSSWAWNFGDNSTLDSVNANPSHTYQATNLSGYVVTLVVTNQYGCSATAQKIVVVNEDYSINIPNAFSPDGDGINDLFVVKNLTKWGRNKFEVFNRWGDVVYSKDNYANDWDGTVNVSSAKIGNNKVVAGTYYFILTIEDKTYKGYIEIHWK